jgi:hypothetical protein
MQLLPIVIFIYNIVAKTMLFLEIQARVTEVKNNLAVLSSFANKLH